MFLQIIAKRPPPRNGCSDCKGQMPKEMPKKHSGLGEFLQTFPGNLATRNTDFDGSEIRRENELRLGSSSHKMLYRCPGGFAEVLNHQQYVQMSNENNRVPGCFGFLSGMKHYPVMWRL